MWCAAKLRQNKYVQDDRMGSLIQQKRNIDNVYYNASVTHI